MRIYEIVTEYASGKDGYGIYDRFRVAVQTFDEAMAAANRKLRGKSNLRVQSIAIIADTRL